MLKDIGLFNRAAVDQRVPAFISSAVYQLWSIPAARGEAAEDMLAVIKLYEDWCGTKLRGGAD